MKLPPYHASRDSFTLVELLVVIGILAILTAAVVIVLNPAELLRQSRDSKRTTDLASLNNAIKLLLTQNPDVSLGSASTVYISLADSSSTCGSYSLPALPAGWQYRCATAANYQKIDSTGWVPISFSSASNVASLPTLPVDPQNAGAYYYSYIAGGSWEIAGLFESEKYAAKAQSDAGVDPERLEVGSNLALWKDAYGLVGYWPMDEGSGTAVADKSGNGNNGSLLSSPVWQAGDNCKVGGCLSFDGLDDSVSIADTPALRLNSDFSISFWYKVTGPANTYPGMVSKGGAGSPGTGYILFYGNSYPSAINLKRDGNQTANVNSAVTTSWMLDTITYSGTTWKWYVNGSLVSSGAVSFVANTNTAPLLLGVANEYGKGVMDDVRFYNRALSAAEVQAIYNATK
jgi:type II secretory pathway pseudopilin PulG